MRSFAYIILGAGSAGFAAAIRANELGVKTALVNAGLPLGGTCVNVGCVPSKRLLYIAELYHHVARRGVPGLEFANAQIRFDQIIQDELQLVVEMRRSKYHDVLEKLEHVTSIEGRARFLDEHQITVGDETLQGDRFLICTGSTAYAPDIPGLSAVPHLTHVEALRLAKLPPSLIILGGGPVALEFGQMYAHLGSKVTLLQRSQVLRQAEPEISRAIMGLFEEEGIAVHEHVQILEAAERDGEVCIKARMQDGTATELVASALMVATGKRANTADLGLASAGVRATADQGAIVVDETMRTTASHIWAAGDVVDAPKREETTAAKEGNIATDNALTNANRKMTYPDVPSVIFTTPAVASVGLTDEEATADGIVCRCVTIPMELVPKAVITDDTRGVIKMVAEVPSRKIVGVHIVSGHAEEIIHEATLAVKLGLTLDDLRDTVHVFPTLAEAIKLVAQAFDKDIGRMACCIE